MNDLQDTETDTKRKKLTLSDKLSIYRKKLITGGKAYKVLSMKYSSAIRCLIKLKKTYPYIFNECLSEEDIRSVMGRRSEDRDNDQEDSHG